MALELSIPLDIPKGITALRSFPYKEGRMASRNWGNIRHSICSFPSKMKPALASTLVALFSTPQSVVFDPFSGSGTITFEAALQGRISIANDLSRLAYVISHAKIRPTKYDDYNAMLNQLDQAIKEHSSRQSLEVMEPEIIEFFHHRTAQEIVVARSFLAESSVDFSSNDTALFLTACLAHILHGNRPYALSRRSHNIIPIPPKGLFVYKPLIPALRNKCDRMLSAPLPPSFRPGDCYCQDAVSLPLKDHSVDTVITSPPFLGTTHFLRQNRVRNWLVGWNYETQASFRDKFLEHQQGVLSYNNIIKELHRVIKKGGLAIFHVGIVKSKNMSDLLHPFFVENGFSLLGTVWEDTKELESHGRTDRGGTHTHGFLIYRRD